MKVHNNLPRKEVYHKTPADRIQCALAIITSGLIMAVIIIQLAKFIGGKL